ncbi:MAG: hypothetical protein QW267_06675 [Sulfolobales archaeon]
MRVSDIIGLIQNKDMQFRLVKNFIDSLAGDKNLLALAYEVLRDVAQDRKSRDSLKVIHALLTAVLSETEG